jgi:3'5'-cyclic nucleotide phosphodiesterase
MQTYWLQIGLKNGLSSSDQTSTSNSSEREADQNADASTTMPTNKNVSMLDSKTRRLVDWNVDVLLRLIKQIVAHRRSCPIPPEQISKPQEERFTAHGVACPIDEVKEIIALPRFVIANSHEDPDDIVLPKAVVDQMREYVSQIASSYPKNPFHSFEHASHVTMSVVKLLSRIVAPKHDESGIFNEATDIASTLHDHTYGITSDPLTQFSCVLAALIHDVDHPGVSNSQLIKENSAISQRYKGKSPSEQHAVDLAWTLLMEEQFKDLRATIYQTDDELVRFRQLIVNSIMATDKADKELKVLRESRWERAFSSNTVDLDQRDNVNRKATIVIEHLIQASDEAHTMQHWHIYRKWNERFFFECYQAYLDGRAEKNPADKWFEREVEFFDYYIIPLVNKLKDCGVFGVSSDEYLNYALRNRQEWIARGRELVSDMLDTIQSNETGMLNST